MSAPFVIRPDTNQVCNGNSTAGKAPRTPDRGAGARSVGTSPQTAAWSTAETRLYSTQDLFLSTFVPGDSNLWHKAKAG